MKTHISLLITTLLLLASQSATASITDVDPTDKSLEYLRLIFGSITNIITGGTGPSGHDSTLGAMSEVLNAGMMIFTGLIIGYTALSSVLNSASEGTPLGRAYSSMWVPLRSILGLSLVLPFAGGFSAMQVGILWLAGNGIGLANTTWEAALDHISQEGTLYPPTISIDFENTAMKILESRVCMHAINTADRHQNIIDKPINILSDQHQITVLRSPNTAALTPQAVQYKVMQRYDSSYSILTATAAYAAAMFTNFNNGVPKAYGANACGSMSLEFAEIDEGTAIASEVRDFQTTIINIYADLDERLDPLAKSIVTTAIDENAQLPDQAAFNLAVESFKAEYLAAVNTAMGAIATARVNKFATGNPDVATNTIGARDAGWITAGAWYWDFQRINAETQKIVSVDTKIESPQGRVLENEDYPIFIDALKAYTERMLVTDPSTLAPVEALARSSYSEDNDGLDAVMNSIQAITNYTLSEPDPMAGLANMGHTIITSFEIAIAAAFLTDLAACVADDTAETVGGLVGGALRPTSSTVCRMTNKSLWLLIFAATLIIPLALMLAFYLPAIPLILWVMSVAGWILLVIEAVIAAPIWAATHAMPEGNGFIGQRAQAGYMVALSLFLRPVLALFGFFAAMLVIIVLGNLVSLLFLPAMSGMIASSLSGVVTFFAMFAIYILLIIQIAHRSFGLIHEIPDKILRYIGGGAENLGESSNEQQTRSIFVAGAAKMVNKSDGGSKIKQASSEAAKPMREGMSKISKLLS